MTSNEVELYYNNSINISRLFQDCQIIKSIDFDEFDMSDIKDISYMFDSCISLENITSFEPNNAEDMTVGYKADQPTCFQFS